MDMSAKIFITVFAVIFTAFLVYAFRYIRKVKKNGLDAEAVVTRYETEETTDSDGFSETRTTYFVEYRTAEGETVEGTLANPKRGLAVGRRMKIKYLPEQKKHPVFIEYL